jgi:hypothetical protein
MYNGKQKEQRGRNVYLYNSKEDIRYVFGLEVDRDYGYGYYNNYVETLKF